MAKPNAAGIPVHDLGAFARFLEERGELIRVREPVDPCLEITELADRFVKDGENPALLFENPVRGRGSAAAGLTADARTSAGRPVPVLINLFASKQRTAWALGCRDLDEAVAKVREPLRLGPPESLWDKVRLLGKLKDWGDAAPRSVGRGPCQEVVVQGDELERRGLLDLMPVLTTWPGDGGPYITTPLVITRNPENGRRNIGMYRMQVFDGRTTGMHWQIHKTGAAHHAEYEKRGERMPVCVAVGGPPVLTYAATAPLPPDIDEALFAGFLTGEPVAMVKAVTCDLEVPAQADFVIEGYVEPGERRLEGDFGDHTGWYSLAEEFPVFHVTAVTSRRDPVYLTTIVGRPPMEDGWLGWATERLFLPLLQVPLPEVVDYHLPVAACFHNLVVVAIRKRYPGAARKVCQALWGTGQIMFTKNVVVVDEDVNVHDLNEVLWRVTGSLDPARDVFFSEGPVDQLDHATNLACYGGKMGIDATTKLPGEKGYERRWPDLVTMDPAVRDETARKWAALLANLRGGARMSAASGSPGLERRGDDAPRFDDVHARETGAWTVRDPDAHGRLVRAMFARISGVYDFMNHLLSFNRDKAWRRRVAALVDGDAWEVLDLCAGTGDLALACRRAGKGKTWFAADFCPEMLRGAAGKAGAADLRTLAADALRLPLRDHCVDAVLVGFGVRNFADVRRGLAEIARVLRPGGQLLVLEFFRDDPAARGEARGVPGFIRAPMRLMVRTLGRLVGRDGGAYSYLPSSMDQFLTPDEFGALLGEFGFGEVTVRRQTFGIAHIVAGEVAVNDPRGAVPGSPGGTSAAPAVGVGWTGASGLVYGVRLVDVLLQAGRDVNLVISAAVAQTAPVEMGHDVDGLVARLATLGPGRLRVFDRHDFGAPLASGSARGGPLVIIPCSMGTVGRIVAGTSETLLLRAADVCLKERRPLIVVPRETPLATHHLEHLAELSRRGVLVLPAMPGFYHRPTSPGDLVDFIVQRVCDHLAVPVDLAPRWGEGSHPAD